jgi:hypothetical protein
VTDLFPDAKASPVPLADMVGCIERELRMRTRVYARAVAEKKMTQQLADRELRLMRAVLDTLINLKGA